MDAKRKSDGRLVSIKRLLRNTEEIAIARYFSDPERRNDPHNHCVPVLDYFTAVVEGSEEHYIVMPLLRKFFEPSFFVISEIVDFMRQMLEVKSTLSKQSNEVNSVLGFGILA